VPMTGKIEQVEAITSVERFRRWSAEEKAANGTSTGQLLHFLLPLLLLAPTDECFAQMPSRPTQLPLKMSNGSFLHLARTSRSG
jgi:hypothetical protein